MTLSEAMESRHTVRKFTDRALSPEIISLLETRIEAHNRANGLNMRLMTEDREAFGPLLRLVLAKGVRNYLVLAGPDVPGTGEALGYCGADVMLYAQTLGLNSWWVGGTYSRKGVKEAAGIRAGQTVLGVIAIGYGSTQGIPHKSKAMGQVSDYDGEAPAWFLRGVRGALLAPTALNRQAFHITGKDSNVMLEYEPGAFSQVDRGIVRYHFELGAGANHFQWIESIRRDEHGHN